MLLVADGNNLAWAGFHALGRAMGAETPDQKVRAALLGLTQSVLGLVVRAGEPPADLARANGATAPPKTPVTRMAVAFDEGRPLRRRAIFPAYQTGREANPAFSENERFVLQAVAEFTAASVFLPFEIVRGVNTEADDLIASLVAGSAEGPVRIASTDRDFLQLVDERLSVYSPVKRLVIDTANFADVTAPRDSSGAAVPFPRERYLDFRAASGDASDDLPGIPGVGPTTAARLLAAAPLDAYFDNVAMVSRTLGRRSRKSEAAFWSGEARAIVERNRGLMDLRRAAAEYPTLDGMCTHGAWDESAFRAWAREQRIAGIELEATCRALAALATRT